MRREVGLGAALVAALFVTSVAGAADAPPLRPADFPKVVTEANLRVKMSDGVVLSVDIRRPAGADGKAAPGKFPAVLTQTPYNKGAGSLAGLAGFSDEIVRRGYVQVVADVRGTGSSAGAWDSFGPREQADSLDLARWIPKQAWSDGTFGTYGPSYMGINQFFTGGQHPAGLKAMFPIIPAEDVYRDVVWHGGEIDAGFIPFWLGIVTALNLIPSSQPITDPSQYLQVLSDRVLNGAGFQSSTITNGISGGNLAFDGPFYETRSPKRVVGNIDVPTFIVGGWWDLFVRGEPRLYNELKLAPGRKQLLMGPWYHITAGDGLGKADTPPQLETLAIDWFDRWLKGRENGIEDFGPVTLYDLGTRRWQAQQTWPRPDILYRRLYLDGGRHSGSARSLNDGALTEDQPATAGTDGGLSNFLAGLCTRSTVQWTAGLVSPGQSCVEDNSSNERQSLTYTTPVMDREMRIQGPISLQLRGATSGADTTWVATLSDVDSAGHSSQLTAGWLVQSRRAMDDGRTRHARNGDVSVPFHPFTQGSLAPVERDKPTDMAIEIFNTNAVIRKRHRLRLTIAAGDVPHMLASTPELAAKIGAVNSVEYGPKVPSFLSLPLVQEGIRPLTLTGVAKRARRDWTIPVRVRCPRTESNCDVEIVVVARGRHGSLASMRTTVPAGTERWVPTTVRPVTRPWLRRRPRARITVTASRVDDGATTSLRRRTTLRSP